MLYLDCHNDQLKGYRSRDLPTCEQDIGNFLCEQILLLRVHLKTNFLLLAFDRVYIPLSGNLLLVLLLVNPFHSLHYIVS